MSICVDYRKLNEVATFDAFPMPQVDDVVEKIRQEKYILTLDLTKGYWQIPMAIQHREKKAVGMPWGLFQFRRMPFRLHGAAALFQRLMDRILAPHQSYTSAYIYYIIIFSEDWVQPCHHLRAVLQELRHAGLTANSKKCALGREENHYLSFQVGQG